MPNDILIRLKFSVSCISDEYPPRPPASPLKPTSRTISHNHSHSVLDSELVSVIWGTSQMVLAPWVPTVHRTPCKPPLIAHTGPEKQGYSKRLQSVGPETQGEFRSYSFLWVSNPIIPLLTRSNSKGLDNSQIFNSHFHH